MSEFPDIQNGRVSDDLFTLFKFQLVKDFESCALDVAFADHIPQQFDLLCDVLSKQVAVISKQSGQNLWQLLYRIDISNQQIKTHTNHNPQLLYEQVVAELIIKRVLQKVVFKKFYAKKNDDSH